jgi:hypothetical protein
VTACVIHFVIEVTYCKSGLFSDFPVIISETRGRCRLCCSRRLNSASISEPDVEHLLEGDEVCHQEPELVRGKQDLGRPRVRRAKSTKSKTVEKGKFI